MHSSRVVSCSSRITLTSRQTVFLLDKRPAAKKAASYIRNYDKRHESDEQYDKKYPVTIGA